MDGDTPHDAVLRTEVALKILKLCFGMEDFHADNSDDLPPSCVVADMWS